MLIWNSLRRPYRVSSAKLGVLYAFDQSLKRFSFDNYYLEDGHYIMK